MRFKIDWASLIVGRKFTVFALFYFVFEGTFQAQTSRGAYRKIPKISPGAYIFQRPFLRGLSVEGNLRFTIDWASLIVGGKLTVFALF